MTEPANATLSHRIIAALHDQRDTLWNGALADVGASAEIPLPVSAEKAETQLHAVIREAFAAVEKDPTLDPQIAIESAAKNRAAAASVSTEAMPADVWARLVATVQVEAARSANTRAINPDSVLLSPDPLLAPKKAAAAGDPDGLNLSPSSRFILATVVAIVVGVGLTVYLVPRPASHPVTSHPGATRAVTMQAATEVRPGTSTAP